MLSIRNGTVVDAAGIIEEDVAIDNGEITSVGDVPETDHEIDATGQFVTPGLIDAHVHLMFDGRPDSSTIHRETQSMLAYTAAANLQEMVRAGVTTVRDLGATGTLALDAGRAVETGVIEGPRVLACGQNITMTGGHGHWFGREADGRAEVTKAVREQQKRGADVIKCMATGGVLTEGARTGAPELTSEELDALVRTASAKDVPTAAHAHGAVGIKNATRAGIDSIEHGTFMDRTAADAMAEQGTYWVPTVSALAGIIENGTEAGIPAWAVEKAETAEVAINDAFEHAIEADVPISMGTDAGTPFNFHRDSPRELERMVEYGLTPEAALEAATVNAADLLRLEDTGRVAEGYVGDILILDANPLNDVSAWREPDHVIQAGTVVR